MSNETTTIVEKIRKLLNLATHPNTDVNEAAAAAARAQALLFTHKLSMAEIEIKTGKAESVGEVPVDEDEDAGDFKWKSGLVAAVGHGAYCKVVQTRAEGELGQDVVRFCVVGKPSDAQVVAYLYLYLTNEIDRLAKSLCHRKSAAYVLSFKLGAVATMWDRFRAQRAEQERSTPTTETALAVIQRNQAEVQSYVDKRFGQLRTVRGERATRQDGFGAGREAGRGINLGGHKSLGAAQARIRD